MAAAIEPDSANALANGLFNFEITDYKSQSAQLLPMIQQHLDQANLKPAQCAAIAVDIGPGGFTSLRTACGVAQGLAVAWQVPTVPLTSFECMLTAQFQDQPVTVLMDARLNEIYAACIHRICWPWMNCRIFTGLQYAIYMCMHKFTNLAPPSFRGRCAQFAWRNWHGRNLRLGESLHRLIVSPCMCVTKLRKPPLNDWR